MHFEVYEDILFVHSRYRHVPGTSTGIKKTQETYQIGEKSADVVLCVSNMFKDIHLSMLSDDDFEEVLYSFSSYQLCTITIQISKPNIESSNLFCWFGMVGYVQSTLCLGATGN